MDKNFAIAEVKAVDSSNPAGEFEAVLSAPTLDRDGEKILAGAFSPLPDHITIDVDHGLSAATTVGSGAPYYDGEFLKIKGSFSSRPLAQEIRQMVREGHIRSMSVAFMGAKRDSDEGVPTITKAELLNAAFVAVPSNREAAVFAVKSAEDGKVDREQAYSEAMEAGWTKPSEVREAEGLPVQVSDNIATTSTTTWAGANTNANAFVLASDGSIQTFGAKTGSRHSAKDMERLGGIHDAVIELGYDCSASKHVTEALSEHMKQVDEQLREAAEARAELSDEVVDLAGELDKSVKALSAALAGDDLDAAKECGAAAAAASLELITGLGLSIAEADADDETRSATDPEAKSGAEDAPDEPSADVDPEAIDLELRVRAMRIAGHLASEEDDEPTAQAS